MMAIKRRTKKSKKNRKAVKSNASIKPRLTPEEMIARLPDKEFINTKELCYVFNDAHPQTIYRYVGDGYFPVYNGHGHRSLYKVAEIKDYIRTRSIPKRKE